MWIKYLGEAYWEPIQTSIIKWSFKKTKRQSLKMAKHTQTILRQIGDELFECVWPFCQIGS